MKKKWALRILFVYLFALQQSSAIAGPSIVTSLKNVEDSSSKKVRFIEERLEQEKQRTKSTLLKRHEALIFDSNQLERALGQVPLGLLEFAEESDLRGTNLSVIEMEEIHSIGPDSEQHRGGLVWSAWVETRKDVKGRYRKPKRNPWGTSDNIGEDKPRLRALPILQGLYPRSSFDGRSNGWTLGHVRAATSSAGSVEDFLDSFVSVENGALQSRDSNSGAWRNLEVSMQKLELEGTYETINYGGYLWGDWEYENLSGNKTKSTAQ